VRLNSATGGRTTPHGRLTGRETQDRLTCMTAVEAGSLASKLGRQGLFEQLAAAIEEQIVARELRPGDRMPSEGTLASQYGVSRAVVREAFARLRERHLIETVNGNGTFVRHPDDNDLVEVLLRHLRLTGGAEAIGNLYEARVAVETMTAQLAAVRASDGELAEIESHLDRMRAHQDAETDWVSADLGFHQAMAQATHNPFLVTLLRPMIELIEDSIRVGHRDPDAVSRGLSGHERIYAALVARDPDAAAVALRAHLMDSQAPLIDVVRRSEPADSPPQN